MALTAKQKVSQSNPMPTALATLLRSRRRWARREDRRDVEAVARSAWWEAQQRQGATVEDCRKAADSAITRFRQPRGSRLGKGSDELARAFSIENLADDQAGADRARDIAESEWDSDALAALTEEQRLLVELLVVADEPYDAVSRKLGVTVHRVRALEAEALVAVSKQIAVLYKEGRVDCSRCTQAGLALLNWLRRNEPGYREVPREFDIVPGANGIETLRRRKTDRRNNRLFIVNTTEAGCEQGTSPPRKADAVRSPDGVESGYGVESGPFKEKSRKQSFVIVNTRACEQNGEWYNILEELGLIKPQKDFEKLMKRDEVPSTGLYPTCYLSPLDRSLFAELGMPVPGPSVTPQEVREQGIAAVLRMLLKYDDFRHVFLRGDGTLELLRKEHELRRLLLQDEEICALALLDDELRKVFPESDEVLTAFLGDSEQT